MCELIDKLSTLIASVPDYVLEGITQIVVTVICGLALAWISSTFFSRKNEITKIEGMLLEKKIPIYKEIARRAEELNNMCIIPTKLVDQAIESLRHSGFDITVDSTTNQIHQAFDDPQNISDKYLELDKYCIENKIYFDDITNYPIMFFLNFLAAFHRFNVMFSEMMQEKGISEEDTRIVSIKREMSVAIAILAKDDISSEIQQLTDAIREFFNHPTLKHRSDPDYSPQTFSMEGGYMITHLQQTKIFNLDNKEKIRNLIALYVGKAIMNI